MCQKTVAKLILLFISVDGEPNEVSKNNQTLITWARNFEKYNFNPVYVFTYTSGSSMYDIVELKVASLSRDTSGLILEI